MRHWLIGMGVLAGVAPAVAVWPAAQPDTTAAEAVQSADDRLYDLHATCAMAVGDAYRWSSNEYERTTITWGEGEDAQVESDTYLSYGITANSRVTEVDDEHRVVAVTHRIERLYLLGEDLLPPGTVLVATLDDDQTVYTVGDDRVANQTLLYVLNRVAALHTQPSRDYATLLAIPETPQPVGARWAVDGPSFLRAMADASVDAEDTRASGEVHFAGTPEVFGVPGLAFDLRFELDGVDPYFEKAHPELELRENTLVVTAQWKGAQSEHHLEQGVELNARLTQAWHDPDEERDGTVVVYREVSTGQRELTERERELLGFE